MKYHRLINKHRYTACTQWDKSQCSQPTKVIYKFGIYFKHICTFISGKLRNVVLYNLSLSMWNTLYT